MSRAALALAVRDQLRSPTNDPTSPGLGLLKEECEVTLMGMPVPMAGEKFVGVYSGGRTVHPTTFGLREVYTVIVAVTMRLPRVPWDRAGPELVAKATVGLDALADSVRALIGKDIFYGNVLARANETLEIDPAEWPTDEHRGFVKGLSFLGDDEPQPVGGSWFHADDEENLAGVVIRQRFGGAERVQNYHANPVT